MIEALRFLCSARPFGEDEFGGCTPFAQSVTIGRSSRRVNMVANTSIAGQPSKGADYDRTRHRQSTHGHGRP